MRKSLPLSAVSDKNGAPNNFGAPDKVGARGNLSLWVAASAATFRNPKKGL